MTMRVTILSTVMGESGSLLTAGSTYTVGREFGEDLVGGNRATDTDGVLTPPQTEMKPYFATDTSGNVTGLVGPGGVDVFELMSLRKPMASLGGGIPLQNWQGAAYPSGGTFAALSNYAWPDGDVYGLRLSYNAAGSYANIELPATRVPLNTTTQVHNLAFYIDNSATETLGFTLTLYSSAVASVLQFKVAARPGLHRYTVSFGQAISSAAGNSLIRYARFETRDDAGFRAWQSGDSAVIGSLCVNSAQTRAQFCVTFDDALETTIKPTFGTGQNYPIAGSTLASVVSSWGIPATMFVPVGAIGTAGYLTSAQILYLQDSLGWTIGNHSYSHPAYSTRGLTSLGPVGYADVGDPYHTLAANDHTAIQADIERATSYFAGLGIETAGRYFALPQGAWDTSVNTAVKNLDFQLVRGVGTDSQTTKHQWNRSNNTGGGMLPPSVTATNNGVVNVPYSFALESVPASQNKTVASVAGNIITATAHGYVTGDPVSIYCAGAASYVPNGLIGGEVYYVILLSADTFSMALTYADAVASSPVAISLTSVGSGTLTLSSHIDIRAYVDAVIARKSLGTSYAHFSSSVVISRLNYLCRYLREREAAGFIEIVPPAAISRI